MKSSSHLVSLSKVLLPLHDICAFFNCRRFFPSWQVIRVYIGSFWSHPLLIPDNRKLFEAEEQDLFKDIQSLPRNAALRKLNDLIKRARLAKVTHTPVRLSAAFIHKDKDKLRLLFCSCACVCFRFPCVSHRSLALVRPLTLTEKACRCHGIKRT